MKRHRRRTCRSCREKFYPDTRLKDRQWHCSKPSCQTKRRSQNIRNWYTKNPDCLRYQRNLTGRWFKEHPDYQTSYRRKHPDIVRKNRKDTRIRMSRIRARRLFDKTNSMFSELTQNKADKCFLNVRSGWLHLRLIKQTRYTEYGRLCQDLGHAPRKVRPFKQAMVDLGWIVTKERLIC